jgi:hypothetical protein
MCRTTKGRNKFFVISAWRQDSENFSEFPLAIRFMYECEPLNRPRTPRLSQLVSKRNPAKALEVQQSLQKLVLYDFTTET